MLFYSVLTIQLILENLCSHLIKVFQNSYREIVDIHPRFPYRKHHKKFLNHTLGLVSLHTIPL